MAISVTGGDKFKAALEDLAKKLGGNPVLKVGFLETAKYPDGENVAEVAYKNEYGNFKQPPRPFFRRMIAVQKKGWPVLVKKSLINTDYDVNGTLDLLGQRIKNQLQNSINEFYEPPLSQTTIMLRYMRRKNKNLVVTPDVVAQARKNVKAGISTAGTSTKPLIDTAVMLRSVDHYIDNKE
jgi:hypothetical protein